MRRARVRVIAAAAALALLVSACGSNDNAADGSTPNSPSASDTEAAQPSDTGAAETSDTGAAETSDTGSADTGQPSTTPPEDGSASESAAGAPSGDKNLTIPIAAGWDEDVAVSNLWKYVLDKQGYDVKLTTLDIAPVFVGVAKGDFDFFFDTWLPNTHEDYWKKYGDQVDDIGVWYEKAPLTIAVPDYMKIDSMDQLDSIGDKVDWTITGIDPGAGLTRITKDKMMPEYLSSKWKLQTSSTSAMLAALKKATDAQKPIVVTLWRPHWAYSAFPIKDLQDPKGAMGAPDSIHVIGSKKFSKGHPDLVAALKKFHMDDESLGSLEKVVLQDYGDGKYQDGVEAWAKDHQDFIDGMLG